MDRPLQFPNEAVSETSAVKPIMKWNLLLLRRVRGRSELCSLAVNDQLDVFRQALGHAIHHVAFEQLHQARTLG